MRTEFYLRNTAKPQRDPKLGFTIVFIILLYLLARDYAKGQRVTAINANEGSALRTSRPGMFDGKTNRSSCVVSFR